MKDSTDFTMRPSFVVAHLILVLSLFQRCDSFQFADIAGPLLDADGWTPVRAPQPSMRLPNNLIMKRTGLSPFSYDEPNDDDRGTWVGNVEVAQERSSSTKHADEARENWVVPQNHKDVFEEEKEPTIIYPVGTNFDGPSGRERPPPPPLSHLLPERVVPGELQERPLRPQQHPVPPPRLASNYPPPSLSKIERRPLPPPQQPLPPLPPPPPPARFDNVRGSPRLPLGPKSEPPQEPALPRSVLGAPKEEREQQQQLQQQSRQTPQQGPAYPTELQRLPPRVPPPPFRRRPARPSGGILAGIQNVGNNLKCAAEDFASDQKLQDERFMRMQLDCVLDRGPCDNIGNTIKRLAPDVIRGVCPPPCDECKKKQIQKVLSVISRKYPKVWNQMVRVLGR